jgi:hypothetical protein
MSLNGQYEGPHLVHGSVFDGGECAEGGFETFETGGF